MSQNIQASYPSDPASTRENWIEQAAILAKGQDTRYARLLPPRDPIADDNSAGVNTPEPMAPEKSAPENMAPETKTLEVERAPNDAKIDDREATIEIVNRPDHQNAYPNTGEDPSEVVKRFLRALTADADADAETEGEEK